MKILRLFICVLNCLTALCYGLTPCEVALFKEEKFGSLITVEGRIVGGHRGAYLVPSNEAPLAAGECFIFLIPPRLNEPFGFPKATFVHTREELDRIFEMHRLGDSLYFSRTTREPRRNLFAVEGIVFIKQGFQKSKNGYGPSGECRVAMEIKSIKIKAGPDQPLKMSMPK